MGGLSLRGQFNSILLSVELKSGLVTKATYDVSATTVVNMIIFKLSKFIQCDIYIPGIIDDVTEKL